MSRLEAEPPAMVGISSFHSEGPRRWFARKGFLKEYGIACTPHPIFKFLFSECHFPLLLPFPIPQLQVEAWPVARPLSTSSVCASAAGDPAASAPFDTLSLAAVAPYQAAGPQNDRPESRVHWCSK